MFQHSLKQFRIRKVTKDKNKILRFQKRLLYKRKNLGVRSTLLQGLKKDTTKETSGTVMQSVPGEGQTGSHLQMSRNLFSGGVHKKAGPYKCTHSAKRMV